MAPPNRPPTAAPRVPRRLVVGIGEFAVSTDPSGVIVTHALGSCIAVCLFDPVAKVAAMLHFLLPEAQINADRARAQPAAFADTGIPLLFQTRPARRARQAACDRQAAPAAPTSASGRPPRRCTIGQRNALAAEASPVAQRRVRGEPGGWRHGGADRCISSVADGRLQIVQRP